MISRAEAEAEVGSDQRRLDIARPVQIMAFPSKMRRTNSSFERGEAKKWMEIKVGMPNIERREFGFLFLSGASGKNRNSEKPFMVRHKSFASEEKLWSFIMDSDPSDCFISTAYYQNPSARKMEEKGWLGADLFYDLDGKPDELFAVKKETIILQHALNEDFGLDSQLIFSGSKGYHVVVITDDEKVLKMESDARREVVDYLEVKHHCVFIDEPASCDVHRLRRLPGTKNSKSGKMCKIVKSTTPPLWKGLE